uniref:Uncharacterized protein n=1 Tax=uncultured bacterium A1Q1_fos_15 TaxID=1256548 RepID=L7W1H6_9BACT|nr:hypothetical protein [uncultured bacterium A1Q1_fos_15]AGC72406.1 hypothetical protein [uncultured bacterium A1Q1_fos_15]
MDAPIGYRAANERCTLELDAAETEWLDLAMQAEEAGLSV